MGTTEKRYIPNQAGYLVIFTNNQSDSTKLFTCMFKKSNRYKTEVNIDVEYLSHLCLAEINVLYQKLKY